MNRTALLAISAANVGVAGLSTIPGVLAFLAQLRERTPKDNFYEDEDGKSTPEAVAAFSQKWQKFTVSLVAAIGFGTSLAVSLVSLLGPHHDHDVLGLENWLATAAWVSCYLFSGIV